MRCSNRSRCNRRRTPWEAFGIRLWGLSLAVEGRHREVPVPKHLGRGNLGRGLSLADGTHKMHGKRINDETKGTRWSRCHLEQRRKRVDL